MSTTQTKTDRTIQAVQAMTQKAAAWLFDVEPRTMRTGPWKDAPRNSDGTYDARLLIAWRRELEAEGSESDPLLAGSNSPALERFRAARADREELELAVRRDQLIDVEEFLSWWDSEVATPVRKSLEKLARKYDQAAVDLVASGLNRARESVSGRFAG